MAELTFKSPGVSTREIDLSGPGTTGPQGIPAGIIGTANQGPAFVPVTVATYADFVARFGASDGEKFGPLAINEWMKNAKAGTYLRVLGIGDGKKRLASNGTDSRSENISAGGVKNAGFIVGSNEPGKDGSIATTGTSNEYAGAGGPPGRAFFLGAFMSESDGSTFLSEAGWGLISNQTSSFPIIQGMVMAPSGVLLSLSGSYQASTTASIKAIGSYAPGADGGAHVGSIDISSNAKWDFVMLLNGHLDTDAYPNLITASLSPKSPNYFPTVFNTDPTKIMQAGHCLYSHYRLEPSQLEVTGSGFVYSASYSDGTYQRQECIFLLTSSIDRNANSATVPNFTTYSDRFRTAFSPWVTSQKFGGTSKNLFRVHLLDDGTVPTNKVKISIQNVRKSSVDDDYGTFDLLVRHKSDTDTQKVVLESYPSLNLNPMSDDCIAKRIGDQRLYFDFDKNVESQKLVLEGTNRNTSVYIRIEMNSEILDGAIEKTALPVGFRGPFHLVTSGSDIISSPSYPHVSWTGLPGANAGGVVPGAGKIADWSTVQNYGNQLREAPVPMRLTVADGIDPKKTANKNYFWGTQFTVQDNLTEPNKSTLKDELKGYATYYPHFSTLYQNAWVGANEGAEDSSGTVYDADRFNNNAFSLENIQVLTKSITDTVDARQWQAASYRRNGVLSSSLKDSVGNWYPGRFLNVDKDLGDVASRKYFKFTFCVQGGFDGVDIFNEDKAKLLDAAAKREMDDTLQGVAEGPTVSSYIKAIDVMAEKSDVDVQLLAIPGIRETKISDHAIDKTEERFDALYIMDVEERDELNNVVTSSIESIGVNNTVDDFKSRNLDSSFGAAYFPDVIITDPATNTNVRCPPSVAVMGALSLNDKVAYPWFAPAGFTRGALASVLETQVKLNRANLDALYDTDINPLTAFPTAQGVVVFGQKTLLATSSALDRVNVRRLLIDIRRKVRQVANSFLFEPNRESTLAKFSAQVNPILSRIQQQQGLDRFKVIIDTSTTTQADVENNTVRGKIFLQPTRSVEFISLDFVVTNTGAEI